MTRHRDIVPLGGMLDTSHRLMSITANKSRADFDADENLQYALTHLLQRIGRNAERVSDAARTQHPEIDWPHVVSLQTRVSLDYKTIIPDAVWFGATVEVPRLLTALEAFMPSDPP
jgi:uncharacterized protein with HEPN domain